jgi:hypothetical protein
MVSGTPGAPAWVKAYAQTFNGPSSASVAGVDESCEMAAQCRRRHAVGAQRQHLIGRKDDEARVGQRGATNTLTLL